MTDQIPAGLTREEAQAVREWAELTLAVWAPDKPVAKAARVVLAALPSPPRPTLADMTDEERAACQWMQCDVAGVRGKWVLATPANEDGDAGLIASYGDICWILPGRVTPRPDLPRLEWPGTGQDGEEVAKVDYVSVAGGRTAYGPWTVARLRKKPDTVPLNTLAMGIVWEDVDALTRACEETGRDQIVVTDKDGDVSVWGADAGWWETGSPDFGFEPYTIIHAGKKADQ